MRKWTKTAGLIFLAAASVYSSQVIVEAVEDGASDRKVALVAPAEAKAETLLAAPGDNTDVKLVDEAPAASSADSATTDPFATGPTTAPSAAADGAIDETAADAATTQPSEGRSVSSSEVSVSDAGTVEIHVNDANLVEVLRMLSLQSQKNIVASKEVHGTITANLYDVTVREALDAILHANGYAYREKGNFIYVYTAKEIADIDKAARTLTTEVFRLFYTPAGNAQTIKRYAVTSANDVPARDPKDWQFQGSNDGSTWTTLNTQSDQSFATRLQANTYNIANTTAYRYYQLDVTANSGGSAYGL